MHEYFWLVNFATGNLSKGRTSIFSKQNIVTMDRSALAPAICGNPRHFCSISYSADSYR